MVRAIVLALVAVALALLGVNAAYVAVLLVFARIELLLDAKVRVELDESEGQR